MARSPTGIAAALDELYAAAPATFTARRDQLAKELKAAGDAEGAAELKARKKPTQIAYVLNQLARRHGEEVAALVDVGRELARAQRKALRGEAGHDLRDAIGRQRSAVSGLTSSAASLMRELGIDPSGHLDTVAGALQSALVDPAVGAELEEGRLEKVPEVAAGFPGAASESDEEGEEPATPRPKKAAPAPSKAETPKPRAKGKAKANASTARADAAEERRARARADAEAAEEERAKAKAKAKAAATEASERGREADEAEREADGFAARAKQQDEEARALAAEAKRLAAEARRVAAEAKRVAHEADVARRHADRAATESKRAAAEARRTRTAASRADEQARAAGASA